MLLVILICLLIIAYSYRRTVYAVQTRPDLNSNPPTERVKD